MVRRITSVWIQPVRPITQSNDMPVNGCVSGCAPNTKCHGGVWEISSRKPAHHVWTGPAYSAEAQLSVSETVMLPPGAGCDGLLMSSLASRTAALIDEAITDLCWDLHPKPAALTSPSTSPSLERPNHPHTPGISESTLSIAPITAPNFAIPPAIPAILVWSVFRPPFVVLICVRMA